MGFEALRFADFLKNSGQKIWQVLPINALSAEYGFSPYSPVSVFGLNHLLISPEWMINSGLVTSREARADFHPRKTDFRASDEFRYYLAETAYKNRKNVLKGEKWDAFQEKNQNWIRDFCLFRALKNYFGLGISWRNWPEGLVRRDKDCISKWEKKLEKEIAVQTILQFAAWSQWLELKDYANSLGIKIMGDLPFYPCLESSDVWSGQELFRLDSQGTPLFVSGAPPDYFSSAGQLWNTPVYSWPAHEKEDFAWWVKRIEKNMEIFDCLRLDHFRGFCAYWQVPAGSDTAASGEWVPAPGEKLMRKLIGACGQKQLIAEDLGEITPDVTRLKEKLGLAGMHVLQFAFGGDMSENPHIPHNHRRNGIVYTGTHDNNTLHGWFTQEADARQIRLLREYTGKRVTRWDVAGRMLKCALSSVAATAVIPVQDVLGLGWRARMNNPAGSKKNWTWRLAPGQLKDSHSRQLARLNGLYGRG